MFLVFLYQRESLQVVKELILVKKSVLKMPTSGSMPDWSVYSLYSDMCIYCERVPLCYLQHSTST
uniref:Uncharacterized protein n=1 Tax=Amphimedon queenslandica TaxID=400682 RepID=A0A1X7V6M7_AMPQE